MELGGFGSELSTISIAFNIALMVFVIRLLKVLGMSPLKVLRKNGSSNNLRYGNPGHGPGDAEICKQNARAIEKIQVELERRGDLLVELRAKYEMTCTEVTKDTDELKDSIRKIYEKLDRKQDK